MASESSSSSPEQDEEVELPQWKNQAFQRTVDGIDPRVKKGSPLYNEVVALLDCVRFSRTKTWSSSPLAKDYCAWSRAVDSQDKPGLAFTIATFRAYDVLCQTRTGLFSRDSEKRGLRAWMEEQLQLLENPQPVEHPKKKKKKAGVKIEKETEETVFTNTSFKPAAILPWIERDSPMSTTSPIVRHSDQQNALPGTNLSIESKPPQVEMAPAKRRRIDDNVFKAVIVMKDAATQTDTSQPAPNSTHNLTETISSAFKNAIAQQTEALGQVFHRNMERMFQSDIVEEGHPRNMSMQNLPPLPAPRQSPLVIYDQQPVAGYHSNMGYEMERHMGQRMVARQVTRVMEETPAFDVEPFRYIPRRTFKREFEY